MRNGRSLRPLARRHLGTDNRGMEDTPDPYDKQLQERRSDLPWYRQPAGPWISMVVLSLFAISFGGLGLLPRVTPGGPFIHISTNVLPAIAALAAIRLGLIKLREKQLATILVSLVFICICTFALSRVLLDVHSYWSRPSSRGSLFGP